MLKAKIKIITILSILSLISLGVFGLFNKQEVVATTWCTSAKCKAAEAAEKEASEKANNARKAAETLQEEVARLNDEIAMYEARISANTAKAEDLASQIEENSKKLALQQAALASMLVDIHFDGQPEAIMILASSNSISDYAEKQSRVDTVKNQVSISAQAVKSLKLELEGQRKEVMRIIADQELQRNAVSERRAYQNQLIAKYRNNESAYSSEAAAARKIKEREIANAIAAANSYGAVGNGVNNYPYRNQCPAANLSFLTEWGYVCQCTSYAGFKASAYWGVSVSGWGHAYSWDDTARALGYRVDTTPAAHTIAVSNAGQWGHVMWVESVNTNGTINLSEYNNTYSAASHLPGDFGYRMGVSTAGLYFVHFD